MNLKQRAAVAALQEIRSGQVVGLGTGSTADFFLIALAEAIKSGQLQGIRGLPTSLQSERRSIELGIPLTTFAQVNTIDVTVDGADEIDPNLNLIKGLGGALLREKIVAEHSKRLVIIADFSKTVSQLGTRSPLPVEVVTFGYELQETFLRSLNCTPILRTDTAKYPFKTDSGNYIFDCRFSQIDDPIQLEQTLRGRAGVVGTGLFLGLASVVYVAGDSKVDKIERK